MSVNENVYATAIGWFWKFSRLFLTINGLHINEKQLKIPAKTYWFQMKGNIKRPSVNENVVDVAIGWVWKFHDFYPTIKGLYNVEKSV